MAGTLPAGPFETLWVAGEPVPYYVLPFDKRGVLLAPLTADHLREAATNGISDIYLFSHGWNVDWDVAVDRYRCFIKGFARLVRDYGRPSEDGKALLVGMFWPSIALPAGTDPEMAGASAVETDADLLSVETLADDVVADSDRAKLYALTQRDHLDTAGAHCLARVLQPLFAGTDGDLPESDTPNIEEIVELWATLNQAFEEDSGIVVVKGPQGPPDTTSDEGPAAAGFLSFLEPRNIVRLATVLLMKDRAGVVGARGVSPLLVELLRAAPNVRVHLIGHSYGCKVLLSAVCSNPLPRRVRSMLLLQPAVSYLALADRLPGLTVSGGYQPAKARCQLPIFITWSRRDRPLRRLFQLAVRRKSDLGEQDIGTAGLERPPSRFAAMGGWGPDGATDVANEVIRSPADGRYVLDSGVRVLALESHDVIRGHGDVVQDATFWALYNLVGAR